VHFLGRSDGLVHISELNYGRPQTVTEVVNEGDEVKVKVLGIDDRGKVRLSMRVVDQESGEDITEKVGENKPRRERDGDKEGGGERRSRGPRRKRDDD
jgi:polyribonucleotide nucleotidyltransferase